MTTMDLISLLITLAALFSYINHRWFKLPPTIGLLLFGLVTSGAVWLCGWFIPTANELPERLIEAVAFDEVVMHGMLGALLFAGALHVNLNDLSKQKTVIAVLATAGVLMSTAIVGAAAWLLLPLFDLAMPLSHCLLFGALIAPTDPIAVIGILKATGVPKSLQTKITGESLFNDGVAVVVFLVIAGAIGVNDHTGGEITASHVACLFAQEAVGGILFGLIAGFVTYRMLRSVDQYQVEVLLSLALVMGGYALATWLHISGPLAMVVAGLLIGNHGRTLAMSERTREHLDSFWELIDEILNAVLFVLIGLEAMAMTLTSTASLAGLGAIVAVLASRFVAVGAVVNTIKLITGRTFTPHAVKLLTWAGLRGGISVALALSIPKQSMGADRPTILTMTYVVVIFSIVVQGLTLGPLVRKCGLAAEKHTAH